MIFVLLETDGCFQAIFSILYLLGDSNTESPGIIRSIVSVLVASEQQAKRRLSALIVLFNLTSTVDSKLEILLGKIVFN